MSYFIPYQKFIDELAFKVYTERLETGGLPPKLEEKKRRRYCTIYKDIIRTTLIELHKDGFAIPGRQAKTGRKKV